MFSLAVENIPFRCLYFCCCFLKRSQMLHYTCGRVVQRRKRNEVLQEWEWMTDEHRNTVGSNTDSFRKAVFFVIVVLGCFFWVFLVSFFFEISFLAAMVNISKCHKMEQHKETYAAPTEFTFIRGWIVQWQALGCLTRVLMGQQIFLEYLRLLRWAPIHLLWLFFFLFAFAFANSGWKDDFIKLLLYVAMFHG